MPVDRNTLTARLEVAQQERERCIIRLGMADGAINECRYWLAQLEANEEVPESLSIADLEVLTGGKVEAIEPLS